MAVTPTEPGWWVVKRAGGSPAEVARVLVLGDRPSAHFADLTGWMWADDPSLRWLYPLGATLPETAEALARQVVPPVAGPTAGPWRCDENGWFRSWHGVPHRAAGFACDDGWSAFSRPSGEYVTDCHDAISLDEAKAAADAWLRSQGVVLL